MGNVSFVNLLPGEGLAVPDMRDLSVGLIVGFAKGVAERDGRARLGGLTRVTDPLDASDSESEDEEWSASDDASSEPESAGSAGSSSGSPSAVSGSTSALCLDLDRPGLSSCRFFCEYEYNPKAHGQFQR